ncbi:MAG: hypothetical protein ACRC2M_07820 [Planktothrix sp.]
MLKSLGWGTKQAILKEGLDEEAVHALNAFILHQLATYHASQNPQGLKPNEYLRFWMEQTLNYLASDDLGKAPPPREYHQLINIIPGTFDNDAQ